MLDIMSPFYFLTSAGCECGGFDLVIVVNVVKVLNSFSKEVQVLFLKDFVSFCLKNFGLMIDLDTLPKAQRTQGIENFDSFNTFSSKRKL